MINRRRSIKHVDKDLKWLENSLRKKMNDYWGGERGLNRKREGVINSWRCWEISQRSWERFIRNFKGNG